MLEITNLLNYVGNHAHTFVAIALGSGVVSVGLEILLTKFKINSSKVAFSLLHLFAGLSAATGLYLGASGKAATGTYAGLALAAQFWHRFVVSGANTKYVTPFLQWLSIQNNGQASSALSVPAGAVSGASSPGSAQIDAKPFTLDSTAGK